MICTAGGIKEDFDQEDFDVWRRLRGSILGPPLGLTQTEGDSAYHAQASSSAEGKLNSGGFERALIPIGSAQPSAVPADASR